MRKKIGIMLLIIALTNSNIVFGASIPKTNTSIYKYSLAKITNIQYGLNIAVTDVTGKWVKANKTQIKYYVDPKNSQSINNKYQFLKLNYTTGVSVTQVNNALKNKGILNKKGQTLLTACKNNNVNPAYLVSHALLETGNGKSTLSNGVIVTKVKGKSVAPKVTYNLFGIGAVDKNAVKLGSEYAYANGWFSVDKSLSGGAAWISKNYINNAINKQNTLYKMRWNPKTTGTHQYSSDISWASKQTKNVKAITDKFSSAALSFDVPKYAK